MLAARENWSITECASDFELVRDVDGHHFSLLNHTNKEGILYWLMQAYEKKNKKIPSF